MFLLIGAFGVIIIVEIIRNANWFCAQPVGLGGNPGSRLFDRFFAGGALKDIAAGALDPEAASYQTVAFRLIWPPKCVIPSGCSLIDQTEPAIGCPA
jgi:hypothetical protein